ncbi:hypothetical protein L249_3546 [Ophiocordyceps polyrhachis-furcata BCC 54312]|uniref:CFEM domain-containing protein n=1 Tax=Ophiocordyceps polyrhachis-furcata BCC 54312 TaxID=1330021 RepID=A0A367LM96_9HYPO|nr:hypothetical protein L249_3546 [Ophiocordyceps polyrhachis-furcata BCC 54312]
MKSSLLFTLAAGLVAAQDLNGLPPCAKDCVTKNMSGSGVGGCPSADIGCICKNKDFLNNIACCLAKACKPEDQTKTIGFAKQLCNAAGVQVPEKVECADKDKAAAAASSTTRASSSSSSATAASTASSSAAGPALAAPGFWVGSLMMMLPAAL